MAGKKIGIVLALDGERQFSQGVSNAKKESAMLNSELKKLSTEYKGNANSLEFLTKKQENLSKQTESYQKRAESAKKGLENAQKVSQKAAQRYEELSKALKEAEKAQENMQKSGKDGTKEYQQQSKEVESLQKAVEKQGLECQKCEGKVSDWSKKVSDAENDIEKNNQALKQNEKYLQEAQNATDKCAKSINEYGKETTTVISTTKEFGESLKEGFGEALAAKGLELAGEAISAIGDKAKEAAEYVVEVGSSFEAGMSEVEAISGATGSELEALENKAKSLGSSTKFSATEAASAMTNMSLAGWSVNQTLSGIDGVLQLAAASNMDLADASQIVTDNISTFNLEASQSTHLADMMAYAQANSSTTAAELGEAYKNCGANMNAAGQDIETTTSFLEALANNGLRSSEAGTSLAAIMRDLTSKMKDGKIAIGDTSVTVMDSNGNFRDMTDVLKDVESATDGMGDAQKQAALMATFTSDSIKGLNMLLNTGADQVAGYEESLRNCSGAASDMADTMQDNLQGKLTELSSATEGLGIAVYDYISGPLQDGVELLTDVVSGLTDAITPQKDAMEEMYDDVIQSSQKVADNVQAIDDQFTGTLNSVENVGALADRLEALNNVEDRTAVQKQEMAAIVDKLSESIPELAGAYDDENDKLSVTNDELEKLVENYQQTAIQQAVIAATQDLINESLAAQVQLDKAQEQKKITEDRMELLEKERELIVKLQEERQKASVDPSYQVDIDFPTEKTKLYTEDTIDNNYRQKASVDPSYQVDIDFPTEKTKLYTEALEKGAITQDEFNYAMEHLSDSSSELDSRLDGIDGRTVAYGDATGIAATSIVDCAEKMEGYSQAIEENQKTIDKCSEEQERYAKSAENITKVKKDNTESTEDNTKAQEDNADAIQATGLAAAGAGTALEGFNKTMERSQEAADAAKTAMRQILDEYNSTMDSIKADLQDKISFADKFDGGDDITTEQMNENLQSWVDGIQNYQQNLQRLKEATDESGQAIFSAEFIQAIQDQGTDAANMLQHMVWTLDNQGEYGVEQLKGISKKWTDAMDISEDTATVLQQWKAGLSFQQPPRNPSCRPYRWRRNVVYRSQRDLQMELQAVR